MSARAITTITCDQCAHLNLPEAFATTSVVVKFNGDAPRQVDLCTDHAGPVEAFQALVRVRGARPDQNVSRGLVCPVCGHPCRNGTGLAAHTRARHGT